MSRQQKCVLYSIMFGGYDKNLNELVQNLSKVAKEADIDAVLFCDKTSAVGITKTAENVQILTLEVKYNDPQRMSRDVKIRPHRYLPLDKYQSSVYIDANLDPTEKLLPTADKILNEAEICEAKHWRNCVYQELQVLKDTKYDSPKRLDYIKEWLRRAGMPVDFGLAQNCVLIRHHALPSVIAFNEYWFAHHIAGSKRDQLSYQYSKWRAQQHKIFPKTYKLDGKELQLLKKHTRQHAKQSYIVNGEKDCLFVVEQFSVCGVDCTKELKKIQSKCMQTFVFVPSGNVPIFEWLLKPVPKTIDTCNQILCLKVRNVKNDSMLEIERVVLPSEKIENDVCLNGPEINIY